MALIDVRRFHTKPLTTSTRLQPDDALFFLRPQAMTLAAELNATLEEGRFVAQPIGGTAYSVIVFEIGNAREIVVRRP